jgi:hypothetical protein
MCISFSLWKNKYLKSFQGKHHGEKPWENKPCGFINIKDKIEIK